MIDVGNGPTASVEHVNNNSQSNSYDNVYGAVIVTLPLREFILWS